jgi:hypothetical protein
MIVNLYPATSKEFIRHHGQRGATNYLRLARRGLELQKSLAKKLLPEPRRQLVEKGSLYVAEEADLAELREEYALLKELGADVQWWDKAQVRCPFRSRLPRLLAAYAHPHPVEYRGHSRPCSYGELHQVEAAHGAKAGFVAGIFFPMDAVIDSASYARALVNAAIATGNAVLYENVPPVLRVRVKRPLKPSSRGRWVGTLVSGGPWQVEASADGAWALVTLVNGERYRTPYAVIATGAFYHDRNTAGIFIGRLLQGARNLIMTSDCLCGRPASPLLVLPRVNTDS